ncbi:IPTL-CTERM sorting domain-containing protein [Ottowia thiooxydans]|uniref:IPTL-CTERM sorting domain-containing protein n=1 Tax=Ottowia thiooxydans TaxID=219182 RepID=UPI0012EB5F09
MRPPGPHSVGQRLDSLYTYSTGDVNIRRNGVCSVVSAVSGNCIGLVGDDGSSEFGTHIFSGNRWRVRAAPVAATVTAVPSLGEWGLLLTGSLVAGFGIYAARNRRPHPLTKS